MNVLDSELVLGQLARLGYASTEDYRRADLVLLNTCSVRQHAEDKVYSRLGEITKAKQRRPEMVVGIIGCMAERDHDGLKTKAPHVDLMCGPGNLNEIPSLLAEVVEDRQARRHSLAIALEQDHSRRTPAAERTRIYDSIEALDLSREMPADGRVLQSYIRVQRGCDKFCTFCVVPFTRGPERSRPPEHIVEEARKLADLGAREITLLGQTVNSYKYAEGAGGPGRTVTFADLLQRVHEVEGIERIRFVTSYPGDFTDDVLRAMRDLPKVCEYLHIPAQSGSNAVLGRMKRQYTVEQYEELLVRAREVVPGISLAGDFIVGFCGETDEDHERTLALVERVRYKNIYMFKYSPRPGTVADRRLPDDVPDEVKQRRHMELAALQKRMCLAHHQAMVGREVEVLAEGYSKAAIKAQEAEQSRGQEISWKRSDQLTGRTRGDEIVVFTGPESLIGEFVRIRVTSATALTLHGEVATRPERVRSLSVL
ncbi:MAG: tRNA (N6-isopentenyl adenosine(37)-C2)-methylthiotransferase MiaB [Planctomycetes bacterium]|nr:tRNA (N6-isopentenyl adenosine(37)-C2)-methylthiotransferase MiaB [Planctomycetota bacterium]